MTAEATALPNQPGDDLERVVQAARDALTDSMVERLAITSGNALEVLDKLNEEDTKEAIMVALEKLTMMHRMGAMNTLFDMVTLIHAARSALTDSMIERLFIFFEHMVNNLATEEIATMASNAHKAMDEAIDETASKPVSGGLFATLSMLGKPEAQEALQFLLAFGCKMQKRAIDMRGSSELDT